MENEEVIRMLDGFETVWQRVSAPAATPVPMPMPDAARFSCPDGSARCTRWFGMTE